MQIRGTVWYRRVMSSWWERHNFIFDGGNKLSMSVTDETWFVFGEYNSQIVITLLTVIVVRGQVMSTRRRCTRQQ